MKSILISENKDKADSRIKQLQAACEAVNEKLTHYNEVEGLAPLKDKGEALAFLQSPEEVLSQKIIESFGDGLTGKRKVNGRALAELYYIPFDEIISQFRHISTIHLIECDFEKGRFLLKSDTIKAIYQRAMDYTSSEEEAAAYELQKQMADSITKYLSVFSPLDFPLHDSTREALRYFGLTTGLSEDGQMILKPDIQYIRRRLSNDSFKERFLSKVEKVKSLLS
jgi:hypothetical protein